MAMGAAARPVGTYAPQARAWGALPASQCTAAADNASRAFGQCAPTEHAAGALGMPPAEEAPIEFMNDAYFGILKAKNALGSELLRRIEAHRRVAAQ